MLRGTTVSTTAGLVAGSFDGQVLAFRGIPYGQPTWGANRFRPPVPAAPWDGVREATAYGASSPQNVPDIAGTDPRRAIYEAFGMQWSEQTISEDCLVLNVWTPGVEDNQRRPVMFRIHGGGFSMGSGSWAWYNGANLAWRGDVVVVTVNHRLGILGYLYLDEIDQSFGGSGNVGQLDLVAALQWVRDNIAEFGGDPNNVTIFGESGGGMKVSSLLSMPVAEGLFHKAIIQSGGASEVKAPKVAALTTRRVFEHLGLNELQVAALQEIPVERLMNAQALLSSRIGHHGRAHATFSPVQDGRLVPMQTGDALMAGASRLVPLIVGGAAQEMTLFRLMDPDQTIWDIDEDELFAQLQPILAGHTETVIASYRRMHPDLSAGELLITVQSELGLGGSGWRLAEQRIQADGAPVYAYRLDWCCPAFGGRAMAAHGICVPLTMANCETSPILRGEPSAQVVSAAMSEAWLAFARTGDPNHPGIPNWPPYSTERRATMIFDDPSRVDLDSLGQLRPLLADSAPPLI